MRLHSRTAVVLAALLTLAASAPIPSQYASDLLDPSAPEFDAVVFKRYFKLRLFPEPNTLQPHHDKCKKKWEAKGAAPDPAREKARAKARAKADTGAAAAKIRARTEPDPAPSQYKGPLMGTNYVSNNSQLFEVEGKETAGERDLDLPDIDKPRFAAVLTRSEERRVGKECPV